MKFSKIAAAAIAVIATGFAAQAQAAVITYDMIDTPHSRPELHTAGFYKFTGGVPNFDSLSFERNGADAAFTYDSDNGTANLSGTAYNIDTDEILSFDLTYTDTVLDGDSLQLNDMGTVGTFGGTAVNGKGFRLTLGDALAGDGWLTNAATGGNFGDFHFAGVKLPGGGGGEVPAPGPLSLIAAMGLFGVLRRKRSAA